MAFDRGRKEGRQPSKTTSNLEGVALKPHVMAESFFVDLDPRPQLISVRLNALGSKHLCFFCILWDFPHIYILEFVPKLLGDA